MPAIIRMPVRTHENFGDSIAKLIKTNEEISAVKENEIILDFSASRMLNPFFLGGLTCLINHLSGIGYSFSLNHQNNPSISSYLETIFFPGTWKTEHERSNFSSLNRYRQKTYIPIVSFKTGESSSDTKAREAVLNALSALMKVQLKFTESQRQPLSYFLDEMTNNINDHSTSSFGYVFAQFYPASNYLDVCISDSGKGIYRSFLEHPKFSPANEIEAVRLALQGQSTKDRPEARGFGLSTTRDMLVNGLHGKFFLWTGNTTYTETVNNIAIASYEGKGYFQGTLIALRLPTIVAGHFDFYKFIE